MSAPQNITELLISTVKKYPMLYNSTLPDSKNPALKKSVWQEIADVTGAKNGEIVSYKWKNLRDCYLKHKKSNLCKSSAGDRKLIHWRWSSHMSFLDPYLKLPKGFADTGETSETLDNSEIVETSETVDTLDGTETTHTLYTEEIEVSDEVDVKYVPDNKITLKRVRSESPANNFGSHFYSASRSPDNREKKRTYVDIDEVPLDPYPSKWNSKGLDKIDYLFLNYAETFKKFSPRRQVLMKLKMAEIFAKAELQEIERDPIGYGNNDDSS